MLVIYNVLITEIAVGSSKKNEISNKIDEDISVLATYVKNLITLGIVKKELHYGETYTRKTIYAIEYIMFCFWYYFVAQDILSIFRGVTDLAYKYIELELSSYMRSVFDDIGKQYLGKLLIDGKCAINFSDIDNWWRANPKTKSQDKIDIMGAYRDSKLFAEGIWTNDKVDFEVLEIFVGRGEMFGYKKKHFYLFAKTGFSKVCIDRVADMGNVTFTNYDEMLTV